MFRHIVMNETIRFNSTGYSNWRINNSSYSAERSDKCFDKETSVWLLIVSLLPLWIILTIIIILLLMSFNDSMRATKVYDNCTKRNAHYVYFVELRTGDSSTSYNRKRTNIMIDLFDENQNSLARVAIPGYMIFGRLEQPNSALEDDKFFELRVTRFWLYRATRFKKVNTIRVTHNGTESDSRIMVYGLEIRSADEGNYKTFFPVMSYISSYGPTNKPNTFFASENNGSIAFIGGTQDDSTSLNPRISSLDYNLFAHLAIGTTIFLISRHTFERLDKGDPKDKREPSPMSSVFSGLLIGLIVFIFTLVVALVFRYVLKYYYAQRMGSGPWAIGYYVTYTILLLTSTGLWIFSVIDDARFHCAYDVRLIGITIIVALAEWFIFSAIAFLVGWFISIFRSRAMDQYVLPDENALAEQAISTQPPLSVESKPRLDTKTRHSRSHSKQRTRNNRHKSISPVPYYTTPYGPNQLDKQSPYSPYKTANYGTTYPTPSAPTVSPFQQTQQMPEPNTIPYPFQVTTMGVNPMNTYNNPVTLQTLGSRKKTNSQESTGSNYYHQLMKNKGGVKSISQYGELLSHKKHLTTNKPPNK